MRRAQMEQTSHPPAQSQAAPTPRAA